MSELYGNIYLNNSGLSNQLMFLFAHIFTCKYKNINILYLGDFLLSINTNYTCDLTDIIDIEHISNLLQIEYSYKLSIFTKKTKKNNNYENKCTIEKAEYFTDNNIKDVTNICKNLIKDNNLIIQKYVNLNHIFGDPEKFVPKKLKITYINKNGETKEHVINEKNNFLETGLIISNICSNNHDYNLSNLGSLFSNRTHYAIDFQNFIIKNFKFSQQIMNNANTFISENITEQNSNINIIHLRIEEDALNHWSKKNKITLHEFKVKIIEMYKTCIDKYLEKKTKVIILSQNNENEIIDYLRDNDYDVCFRKNKGSFRELEAAIDMQIGLMCNNIFIGVENSTFSQILYKKINNNKTILLNYEYINTKPTIISYVK
jgi:hypothetical protein